VSQRLRERHVVLLVGLLAGLPVLVATLDAVTSGWTPIADNALIATSAYDVFTAHSPLLGPWSSGYSSIVGQPTFHPGPLLFWVLAIPARLPWDWALEAVAGLINLACVLGIVALAHRRGGRPLMVATAIALPILLASMPAEAYSDIWNPYMPLLPLLLLLFLAWSIGCGEYRLLPLAVLAASFAPQSHLSFAPPAAAALAVGLAGLVASQRGALLRPPARTWIVVAAGVAIACWAFPIAEQVTSDPGNGRLLYRAARADEPKLGATIGWHALVHTVGVVPWWLRDPPVGLDRVVDLSDGPSALAVASTLAILALLAAMLALSWRRRRHDLVVVSALALAVSVTPLLVVMSTPEVSFATLGYSIFWVSPVGMFVWLAAGWSAWQLAFGRVRVPARSLRLVSAGAVVSIAIVAGIVAAGVHLRSEPWDQMRTIAARLRADLPRDRPARIVVAGTPKATFMGLGIQSGIVYALRRDGRRVVAPGVSDYLGSEYTQEEAGGPTQLLRVDAGSTPPAGGRSLARVRVSKWPVAVTLLRSTAP
jgi:hypothetical protein